MAEQTSSAARPKPGMVGVFRVAAIVTVAVIVVQFFLAGWGAFHAVHAGVAAKDTSAYDAHKGVGYLIGLLSLVLLILAIIGKMGGRAIGMTATLVVLAVILQPLLAGLGEDSGAFVGGLHAFVGALILGLAGNLISMTMRRR